ncbi:uncharacterized [Tachysurus ichikawai]
MKLVLLTVRHAATEAERSAVQTQDEDSIFFHLLCYRSTEALQQRWRKLSSSLLCALEISLCSLDGDHLLVSHSHPLTLDPPTVLLRFI